VHGSSHTTTYRIPDDATATPAHTDTDNTLYTGIIIKRHIASCVACPIRDAHFHYFSRRSSITDVSHTIGGRPTGSETTAN